MTRTPPSDPLIAPLVSSSRPSRSCESTEAAESHFVCAICRIHQSAPDRVEISARDKGPGRSGLRGQREATLLARAFLSSACLFWPLVPPSTACELIRPRPSTSRHRDRGLTGWQRRTVATRGTGSSSRRSGLSSVSLGDQGVLILRSKSIDADHDDRPLIHA